MSQQLRIWYVIDSYAGPFAGTEKQLLLLIRRMVELGHEVRLFVLRHTDWTHSAPDFPCPIESLEVPAIASMVSARRMLAFRARIRRERPDVLHAFFNDAAMLIPIYCKTPGMRLFTSRRDMGFWHTPVSLALLRIANRRVDGVICNSRAVAELTRVREAARASQLMVIHNGIAASAPPMADMHRGDGAPVGEFPDSASFNVCLVANLRPIKRIEDLIAAAARVVGAVPGARFWIAGETLDTAYEARLRALVNEMELSSAVHFLGVLSDPLPLMRSCRVGVLCSESEGLSNTIMEYLLCGLPVVCSAVGGNPELVEDGVTGVLYPCGSVDALAEALINLAQDPTTRGLMAEAAAKQAKSFTPKALGEAHLRAYLGTASSVS